MELATHRIKVKREPIKSFSRKLNFMKFLKITVALAVTGLFVGTGMTAHAQDPVDPSSIYTGSLQEFQFESSASAGDTTLDGSTITIGTAADGSYGLEGWDLLFYDTRITALNPTATTYQFTPANSAVNSDNTFTSITSYTTGSSGTWLGIFQIIEDNPDPVYPPGFDVNYTGSNSGAGGDGDGTLDLNPDPQGTWTPIVFDSSPVPDTASSLQLFAIALAALGASRLFFPRRMAVVVR